MEKRHTPRNSKAGVGWIALHRSTRCGVGRRAGRAFTCGHGVWGRARWCPGLKPGLRVGTSVDGEAASTPRNAQAGVGWIALHRSTRCGVGRRAGRAFTCGHGVWGRARWCPGLKPGLRVGTSVDGEAASTPRNAQAGVGWIALHRSTRCGVGRRAGRAFTCGHGVWGRARWCPGLKPGLRVGTSVDGEAAYPTELQGRRRVDRASSIHAVRGWSLGSVCLPCDHGVWGRACWWMGKAPSPLQPGGSG